MPEPTLAGIQIGWKNLNANSKIETENDFVNDMAASWGNPVIPMFKRKAMMAA